MADSNRVCWNDVTEVWEPITEEEFGEAIEFRGRPLTTDVPVDGDVYIWSDSLEMWILGQVATGEELETHASATTDVHGFDSSGKAPPQDHDNTSHSTSFATVTELTTHTGDDENPHAVTAAQADAEPSGAVATHASISTGIHGVGISTIESVSGAQSKVDSHSSTTTGVHGVGGYAVASVDDIAEHSDETTGVHGVGASTIESVSGAQAKVNTHSSATSGVHGVGGYAVASVDDIDEHAGETSGVHGVGASSVASLTYVTGAVVTHASTVEVHGVQVETKDSSQDFTSTSFSNVNYMYGYVSANTIYEIDVMIVYTTDATSTGINLGISAPSGSIAGQVQTSDSSGAMAARTITSFNQSNAFLSSTAGDNVAVMTCLVNMGGTGGTLYVRCACEGSDQTVTIKAGSVIRTRKVE